MDIRKFIWQICLQIIEKFVYHSSSLAYDRHLKVANRPHTLVFSHGSQATLIVATCIFNHNCMDLSYSEMKHLDLNWMYTILFRISNARTLLY